MNIIDSIKKTFAKVAQKRDQRRLDINEEIQNNLTKGVLDPKNSRLRIRYPLALAFALDRYSYNDPELKTALLMLVDMKIDKSQALIEARRGEGAFKRLVRELNEVNTGTEWYLSKLQKAKQAIIDGKYNIHDRGSIGASLDDSFFNDPRTVKIWDITSKMEIKKTSDRLMKRSVKYNI